MQTSSFANFGHVEEPTHSVHSDRARTRSARQSLVAREPRQHQRVRGGTRTSAQDRRDASWRRNSLRSVAVPGVRRIYLKRVVAHLYYTFDDDEVIVPALWGARRERGPRL